MVLAVDTDNIKASFCAMVCEKETINVCNRNQHTWMALTFPRGDTWKYPLWYIDGSKHISKGENIEPRKWRAILPVALSSEVLVPAD